MAYPYYQNNQYYMQNMQDLQNMKEKIDRQIQQMQQFNQNQMQQQPIQQPTNLTQNFQLASNPTNNELESKYANNIDEVKNTFVMKTGIFLKKDFTTLWVKSTDGSIKIFELNEIIEEDPKDLEIRSLKEQIQRMKGMINNESNANNSNFDEQVESKNTPKLSTRKQSNAKQQ